MIELAREAERRAGCGRSRRVEGDLFPCKLQLRRSMSLPCIITSSASIDFCSARDIREGAYPATHNLYWRESSNQWRFVDLSRRQLPSTCTSRGSRWAPALFPRPRGGRAEARGGAAGTVWRPADGAQVCVSFSAPGSNLPASGSHGSTQIIYLQIVTCCGERPRQSCLECAAPEVNPAHIKCAVCLLWPAALRSPLGAA